MYAVVLPSVTQGLGLNEIQIGYLQSARQLTSGTMNLPAGLLADSFARSRPPSSPRRSSSWVPDISAWESLGGLGGAHAGGGVGRPRHRGVASARHGRPLAALSRAPGHGPLDPRHGGHDLRHAHPAGRRRPARGRVLARLSSCAAPGRDRRGPAGLARPRQPVHPDGRAAIGAELAGDVRTILQTRRSWPSPSPTASWRCPGR